ncbi:glycoside hydrolase family 36 protein [Tepidiforma sp.]|uniref:glycoside hydrolase family 36 protein n=1 Tax=Tepidiforma sp. TaxID=2682230 RepID=UPI002ADD7908|nr:glycoside hydrolase family 36 protein [Tepidiforma sp.]
MNRLPWDLWLAPAGLPEGLELETAYDPASGELALTVRNVGPAPASPRDIRLAAAGETPAAEGWVWLHGRYMQMDALVRNFGAPAPEGYDGRFARPGEDHICYVSREVAALVLPYHPAPALLAGCLQPDRYFFDIEFTLDRDEATLREIALVYDLDGVVLSPGEQLSLPPVLLVEGHDPVAMVEEYADRVAARLRARVPDLVPTGWCSWYFFYNRVSEADVLANLEAMVRERHPAEYVQIDDGYQSHTGDWLTPNEKFPSGMAALAARIREAGYRPGIWLAPFVLHEDSAALRDHPQMVLRTPEGDILFVQTWLGRCAVLDCTHPAAESWLRNVIRTVVREWGYDYLKLDACTYAARPASTVRYHRPGTTAAMNLRRGLEIIREEAGDSTFLLGCTCHFGPAIGLVDAMRVGPDVKETWADGPNPSVRHAMRLTLQRNWMHRRWWVNDPDCLIVRDNNTDLTEAEVRFLATSVALSGGMVVASDDLPALSPARRELALALFPPAGVAARPLEPGDGPVPRAWRADLGDGRALVGILNWSDEPLWVPWSEILRPGEVAFDLWNRRPLPMGDVYLRPHEGTLWQVYAPARTPRLVGDSGHITSAGLYQRQVSGRLQLRNDRAYPRRVAVQHRGYTRVEVLQPGEMRWFD